MPLSMSKAFYSWTYITVFVLRHLLVKKFAESTREPFLLAQS